VQSELALDYRDSKCYHAAIMLNSAFFSYYFFENQPCRGCLAGDRFVLTE
jgi:hypothetical protein